MGPNRLARRKRRPVDLPCVDEAVADSLASGELRRLPNALGQAALLEWLGQSPISFNRAYVGIAGGVLPALWLSAAMERVAQAKAGEFEPNGDFVFAMSTQECETATGLIRSQQLRCRRDLIGAQLLSEQAKPGAAMLYRLHLERVARALMAQSAPLAERLASYEPLPELPPDWARQA